MLALLHVDAASVSTRSRGCSAPGTQRSQQQLQQLPQQPLQPMARQLQGVESHLLRTRHQLSACADLQGPDSPSTVTAAAVTDSH
jgi:hypothetical protein